MKNIYERRTYEKTIESYRSDKVRALTRARRVEIELEEANKFVKKYKKGKELGL